MLDVLQESMYVYSSTFFRVSDFDHHQKSHPESQTCGRMDSRILRIVRFIVYLNQPMIPMIHPSFRPRKQILPPNWNQQPRSSAAK